MEREVSRDSVGIFWGEEAAQTQHSDLLASSRTQLPPLPPKSAGIQTANLAAIATLRSTRSTPRIPAGRSSSPLPPRGDNASQTLLGVLQTLHKSIQRDMDAFTGKTRAFDLPSTTNSRMGNASKPYYPLAVEVEDRSYFINERSVEANLEIIHAHVRCLRD